MRFSKGFRLLSFLVLLLLTSQAAALAEARVFSLMSYNVENLFHPDDDPLKNDDDFTPDGRNNWTYEKLRLKVRNLSRVLKSVNNGAGPSIVALTEVENEEVLRYWIRRELEPLGYRPVLIEGPDRRGIDVAILTKFPLFAPPQSINVSLPHAKYPTRDVLHLTFDIGGVPFHVFVNHWPSRLGGDYAKHYRKEIGRHIQSEIERIMENDEQADIVVLGDFNDEVENTSLKSGLRTTWDLEMMLNPDNRVYLYDLMFEKLGLPIPMLLKKYKDEFDGDPDYNPEAYERQVRKERGTYYYHSGREWSQLDHMLLNRNVFNSDRVTYYRSSYRVVRLPFMVDKNQAPKSFRYFKDQGYSDHFPIVARFIAHLDD